MPLHPERRVNSLGISAHGGIDPAEMKALGIDPETVIDFSVSTNPFMPPPGIREMLSSVRIDRYPDSRCTELRQRLSEKSGLSPDNIVVGSGTTELIRLIAVTFLKNNDRVLLLEPTYGDYEVAVRMAGAMIIGHRAREEDDFIHRTEEVVKLIDRHKPRAVFICNPDNPTGRYLPQRAVETVLDEVDDGLVILDEAYVAFVEARWNSFDLISRENVIVLRSMTKDYGLPGLRLGYAAACRAIIDGMLPALPPWNVNSIAQKVGVAVLEKDDYLEQSLLRVRQAKRFLTGELTSLGFRVLASDVNYFLVRVGNARDFRLSLLKHGILVRDCTSFGLPEYIRLSARTLPECKQLIRALTRTLCDGEYIFSDQDKKRI